MMVSERARTLVEKIDHVSKQPLAVRAMQAERLVREAASILLSLSLESELAATLAADIRARLDRLEKNLTAGGS